MSNITAKTAWSGTNLTFSVSATDPDGQTLAYSSQNLPGGATFNPSTKVFSWTPTALQGGLWYPRFRATDPDGLYDEKTATITVNVNHAPVLNPIGNKSVDENITLSFVVSATDEDGGTLTYSCSKYPNPSAATPTGFTFNATSRTFTWKPTYTQDRKSVV